MDSTLSMVFLILLSAVGIFLFARKLKIFQNKARSLSILRMALRDRFCAIFGISFAVFYGVVFLVFGGEGGRIHILFGRLIFNMTLGDGILGAIVMILVSLAMTLFAFNIKIMGLPKGSKSGLGVFGAGLALLASFCP